MKRTLFSFLLICIFAVCFAQPVKDTSIKTLQPVQKTNLKQTLKQPTNRIIEKLPDLRITTVNVNATHTGTGIYTLTISFTLKNEGNAPISYSNISAQGLFTAEKIASNL